MAESGATDHPNASSPTTESVSGEAVPANDQLQNPVAPSKSGESANLPPPTQGEREGLKEKAASRGEAAYYVEGLKGSLAAGDNVTQFNARNISILQGENGRLRTRLERYERRIVDYESKRETLVRPKGLAEYPNQLAQHFLAIVGPPATGRYSAAVFYTSELIKGRMVSRVYEVPDDTDMDESALFEDATPGRLIIIEDAMASSKSLVRRLLRSRGDAGSLRQLRDALRGTRLVVTISEEHLSRFFSPDLAEGHTHEKQFFRNCVPDSAREVLRRHLARWVGEERARQLLDSLEELETQLAPMAGAPPKIAELAACIARECDEKNSDAAWHDALLRNLQKLVDPRAEVHSFLTELTAEEKMRAVQLSFFEGVPENEFWRFSALLHPDARRRDRRSDWFGENVPFLRERLRAETTDEIYYSDGHEHSMPHIRFRSKYFGKLVRQYAKENHPDLVRAIHNRLADSISTDLALRRHGPRALGLMAPVDWPRTESLVYQWTAQDGSSDWDVLAAQTIATACLTADAKAFGSRVLEQWRKPAEDGRQSNIHLAAAAATYRYIGRSQIERAIAGLHEIACQIDLAPLAATLPLDLYFAEIKDSSSLDGELLNYVVDACGASQEDDPQLAEAKLNRYSKEISEARGVWGSRKVAFEAFQHALLSLGLLESQLDSIVQVLCDWSREDEEKRKHTIRLTTAFVTWRLTQYLGYLRKNDPRQPDPLFVLIDLDEDMLDTAGELFAATMIRLYALKLPRGARMTSRFCSVFEEWIRLWPSDQQAVARRLIASIRGHLGDKTLAAQYGRRVLARAIPGA